MLVTFDELPKSPGYVFYDRLQTVLADAGFDAFVERLCQPYDAAVMGAPSLPPGRYFRMHLVGYFEGIDSEHGLEWRCADSLSLRGFLGLGLRDRVPDHSWLSRSRARLPLDVHERVFAWVLERLAECGLVKGERIGVDASTMEANAAMRGIRRRNSGEGYREMLARMAADSGIATPSAAELKQFDRARKGKRLSNAEWASPTDPEARITRLQDGRTRLAYKPEHAVDLDTGAIVAAEIQPADQGDTTTLETTLKAAARGLDTAGCGPTIERPAELIADKGYHSRAVLKDLAGGPGRPGSRSPPPRMCNAGAAISRPGGRFMAIERGCGPGSARRRWRCAPRRSNAASRWSSTGVACAAPMSGAGRTSRSATSSMSRATTSAWCCAS